eukprot:s3560_g11.t1
MSCSLRGWSRSRPASLGHLEAAAHHCWLLCTIYLPLAFSAMSSLAPTLCRGFRKGMVPPAVTAVQRRFLNLHEYQAQIIFQKFGVGVPKNLPAFSVTEAVEKAKEIPGDEVVVKAQVLAGGRGLGHFKENSFQGGVHIVPKTKVAEIAEKMLGKTLITKQTGEEGKPNNTVLLAEKVSIKDEKYFAILMDRASGGPLMIGSKTGGTSIEDGPTPVDIIEGIKMPDAEKMATEMGFSGAQAKEAATLMANLYKDGISCHTGTKQRAAGPHNDLPDQRRSGKS